MVKVHVESYGCSRNKADGEMMEALLLKSGYGLAETPEKADYVVVNTCAVKDPTELKMAKRIKELLDSEGYRYRLSRPRQPRRNRPARLGDFGR